MQLPEGWAQSYCGGELRVQWKDQGWGNGKGHLWGRLSTSNDWVRLSNQVAPHEWTAMSFMLPDAWFNDSVGKAKQLHLAYEVRFV